MGIKKFIELREYPGGQFFIREDQILSIELSPTRDHKNVLHFITCLRTEIGTRYVQETVGEVKQKILDCQRRWPKLEPKKLRPQKNTRRMTDAELRGEVF